VTSPAIRTPGFAFRSHTPRMRKPVRLTNAQISASVLTESPNMQAAPCSFKRKTPRMTIRSSSSRG
jgi:hypothetical protein